MSSTDRSGAKLLAEVVERVRLNGHDGRSGARLERVRLADGRTLVVKHIDPARDLVHLVTGGPRSRELHLWEQGVLAGLPAGVGHAVVAGWWEDDGSAVLVMTDLGRSVLSWHRRLSRTECQRVLAAATAVHDTFRSSAASISGLCPLATRTTLFAPWRMATHADGPNLLPRLVIRGWERFADIAPRDVVDAVFAVFDDAHRLADRLSACDRTLIHGDLWLVNVALTPDTVVLLDWEIATLAPPAYELATFLVGNASQVDARREDVISDFVRLCGDRHDQRALELSLFAGLVELGWNKALDAVEHADPKTRAAANAELEWWTAAARRTFDAGLL